MEPNEVDQVDPYWKLRPLSATPEAELCKCAGRLPIVLQDHLSPNPIVCLRCNGEVPPERIGFSAELAERIAFWTRLHDAIVALWLDSADYESFARAWLEDPNGRVTVLGLEVVQELNSYHRAYYGWFQDTTADDFVPSSQCPRCSAGLVERFGRQVCDSCSIVVPNG